MNSKQLNNLQRAQKSTAAHLERVICEYALISKEQRYQFIFDTGWDYLVEMEGDPEQDEHTRQQFLSIATCRAYWNWWQAEWQRRDLAYRKQIINRYMDKEASARTSSYWAWHRLQAVRVSTELDDNYYNMLDIQGI